uniref:Uncharacterized protein n=1 Tax=Wuchereria bancrofti TaxID=6293 RepID=A0A1I8EL15_WUCBA
MIHHPTATIIRRNFYDRNYKYHQINESKLSTLWIACRAIVFGGVIILFGILMTILGYFDVYLSQEIVHSGNDGADKLSTNWTKRYLFKSLQYFGPVAMGIGSFILIVACVITLESRDKNTQVLHNIEVNPCKKTSLLQRDVIQEHLPMTDQEIREWTPLYKAVPLSRRDFTPRNCMGVTLTVITVVSLTSKMISYLTCTITVALVRPQDVTVEMHSPPSMLLSSTPQKNQSALAVCCSTSRRTNDLAYIEHNSSNIVVTIDPSATDDTAVDVRPSAQDSGRIPDGFEKHAPLASLDIEFGTSSSSSSSNMKALNVDSSFTI